MVLNRQLAIGDQPQDVTARLAIRALTAADESELSHELYLIP